MRLLTFAYQGEAQCFIHEFKHKILEYCSLDYYQNNDSILLITGEGVQSATEKVAIILSHFKGEIKQIFNFGIAGALTRTLNKNDIVEIRTSYRSQNKQLMFKSFTDKKAVSVYDCITADERILSDEQAQSHSNFAQIVDRELWGISSAAFNYGLSVHSYKLISDHAGNETSCFDIKHQALTFSEQLYTFYQSLNFAETNKNTESTELLSTDFYCSLSQERKLKSLLETLTLKYQKSENEILSDELLNKIITSEKNRKKRTILLLESLELTLNPFQSELENSLKSIIKPFTDIQSKVKFTKHYENNDFELSMRIEHEKHLVKFKDAIEQFDYTALISLLNGESK